MAWIEVHQSVVTHRKALALADVLELSPVEVVGHLVLLWLWAVDNAPTGELSGVSDGVIARAVQWTGAPSTLIAGLVSVGLVDESASGGLMIHDWPEYGGRLALRREQNAQRMREWRSRQAQNGYVHDSNAARNAHVQGQPDPTGHNSTQHDRVGIRTSGGATGAGKKSSKPLVKNAESAQAPSVGTTVDHINDSGLNDEEEAARVAALKAKAHALRDKKQREWEARHGIVRPSS